MFPHRCDLPPTSASPAQARKSYIRADSRDIQALIVTRAACLAVGRARATHYRHQAPPKRVHSGVIVHPRPGRTNLVRRGSPPGAGGTSPPALGVADPGPGLDLPADQLDQRLQPAQRRELVSPVPWGARMDESTISASAESVVVDGEC